MMTKMMIRCHNMVELDCKTGRFECIEDWSKKDEMKFSSAVEKST